MSDEVRRGISLNDPLASTAICIFASAVAGTGIGYFGCVLSYADKLASDPGGVHAKRARRLQRLGALGSTVFGISSLVGLFFGPVSLVVVVRAGSTLPANAFFSQVFGLCRLTREDYIGIFATIAGVICFALFKGTADASTNPREILAQMIEPGALAVLGLMLALMLGSSALGWRLARIAPETLTRTAARTRTFALALCVTNATSTSSAFMDLATKTWGAAASTGLGLAVRSATFWVAVGLNIVFLVCMRLGTIYGCARADVSIFVPMNTVGNIICSAMMGMVVLLEYRSVSSFVGLAAAFCALMAGIILLISPGSGGILDDDDDDSALAAGGAHGAAELGGVDEHGRLLCGSARAGAAHASLDARRRERAHSTERGNVPQSSHATPRPRSSSIPSLARSPAERQHPSTTTDEESAESSAHPDEIEAQKWYFAKKRALSRIEGKPLWEASGARSTREPPLPPHAARKSGRRTEPRSRADSFSNALSAQSPWPAQPAGATAGPASFSRAGSCSRSAAAGPGPRRASNTSATVDLPGEQREGGGLLTLIERTLPAGSAALAQLNRVHARQALRRTEVEQLRRELNGMSALLRHRDADAAASAASSARPPPHDGGGGDDARRIGLAQALFSAAGQKRSNSLSTEQLQLAKRGAEDEPPTEPLAATVREMSSKSLRTAGAHERGGDTPDCQAPADTQPPRAPRIADPASAERNLGPPSAQPPAVDEQRGSLRLDFEA